MSFHFLIVSTCIKWEHWEESLREKYPNVEFFWSVFSRIWTEYCDLLSKTQYSLQIRENTDQKKHHIWILFMQ